MESIINEICSYRLFVPGPPGAVPDDGGGVLPHAASIRLGAHPSLPAQEYLSDTVILQSGLEHLFFIVIKEIKIVCLYI